MRVLVSGSILTSAISGTCLIGTIIFIFVYSQGLLVNLRKTGAKTKLFNLKVFLDLQEIRDSGSQFALMGKRINADFSMEYLASEGGHTL
jgi:hypothetical protein